MLERLFLQLERAVVSPSRVPQVDIPQISSILEFTVLANEHFKPCTGILPAQVFSTGAEFLAIDDDPDPLSLGTDADEIIKVADDFSAAVSVNENSIANHGEVIEQWNRDIIIAFAAFHKSAVSMRFAYSDLVARAFLTADPAHRARRVTEDSHFIRTRDSPE